MNLINVYDSFKINISIYKTMLILMMTIHLSFIIIVAMRCSNESPPIAPKFYLIEKCHRSKLAVVARANYASLTSCQRLGVEKKALAFNFSPQEALNYSRKPMQYTCEVLKCSEVSGGLTLTNDSRFDYYSIYANPIPDVSSSCVPATGMFRLLKKKLNYTQAEMECRNMSGVLAGVTSEQRTDTLAQFISGIKVEAAYVGMRRRSTKQFINTNGDSLECTTYRAWAPGHPRRQYNRYDCAVLTRYRTWRSTPCTEKHYALCELIPAGPYKKGTIFPTEKNETEITDNMDVSTIDMTSL